jgi:hypothetical protein
MFVVNAWVARPVVAEGAVSGLWLVVAMLDIATRAAQSALDSGAGAPNRGQTGGMRYLPPY